MTQTEAPSQAVPSQLAVLPIRNAVLFPGISMPLVVGRERSLLAVEAASKADGLILVVAQKTLTPGDPAPGDLYKTGTLCKIENSAPGESGGRQVVATGVARYRVLDYTNGSSHAPILARGEVTPDLDIGPPSQKQALFESLKELSHGLVELLPGATEALTRLLERIEDPTYLTHVTSAYLSLNLTQKQDLLETLDIQTRMEKLIEFIRKERDVLQVQKEIREKMSERMGKAQREALLREQLRTIRSELGEDGSEEVSDDLSERIQRSGMTGEALKQAEEELRRLRQLPSASAEYHVVRSYLEWMSALPWQLTTPDRLDLAKARTILDQDHAGLETVKKRILQFLAVAKLKNDLSGPILCLVGPPGVGKTSLGQSIARTLGRKFIRTSLGGVRDEAEIRGHRRTYVGAMPGRIIQSIKRAGSKNPVMMLDEIDKLRADFQGDPSSAMLEVLDPEQNKSFSDHYLDVPFDLSQVFFIATANVLDTIAPPLRDRMEVIEVSGYTNDEKLVIARTHLFPKQLKENGVLASQIEVSDLALADLITHYTREAGVRELQRKLASLIRATAERIVTHPEAQGPIRIEPQNLPEFLGPRKFEPEVAVRIVKPGIATGLAWTPHGGEILFIEATRMPGKGSLILTGQLGDVMKESAQIALSLARAAAGSTPGAAPFEFGSSDLHIHVPAGGIPKDGPSAGVTIVAAITSLLRNENIDPAIGMTGEITLRGAVLPVGGIKEKLIAAHRAGIKTILLPTKNAPDLEEVPKKILSALRIEYIDTIDDLVAAVFGESRKEEVA